MCVCVCVKRRTHLYIGLFYLWQDSRPPTPNSARSRSAYFLKRVNSKLSLSSTRETQSKEPPSPRETQVHTHTHTHLHTHTYTRTLKHTHKHTHTHLHIDVLPVKFHMNEWVTSHHWVGHLTRPNTTRRTYKSVMSHAQMSHVTRTNESRHTYNWVMSHVWMSPVAHTNESCYTYEFVMSHVWKSRVTRTDKSRCTYEWGMSHMQIKHITHVNVSCRTHDVASIGRLLKIIGLFCKRDLSFAKETYKRDDFLQKRPINLRSLLIEATHMMFPSQNAGESTYSLSSWRASCNIVWHMMWMCTSRRV